MEAEILKAIQELTAQLTRVQENLEVRVSNLESSVNLETVSNQKVLNDRLQTSSDAILQDNKLLHERLRTHKTEVLEKLREVEGYVRRVENALTDFKGKVDVNTAVSSYKWLNNNNYWKLIKALVLIIFSALAGAFAKTMFLK